MSCKYMSTLVLSIVLISYIIMNKKNKQAFAMVSFRCLFCCYGKFHVFVFVAMVSFMCLFCCHGKIHVFVLLNRQCGRDILVEFSVSSSVSREGGPGFDEDKMFLSIPNGKCIRI